MCMDAAGPTPVLPLGWPRPRGYSQAYRVPAGHDLLVLAGQIGWDHDEVLVGSGLVAQFEQALRNCVTIVATAGGGPEHIVRFTMYCTDKRAYLSALAEVGDAYRRVMGTHYPAMSLVEVVALVEPGALLEIEATAAVPPLTREGGSA